MQGAWNPPLALVVCEGILANRFEMPDVRELRQEQRATAGSYGMKNKRGNCRFLRNEKQEGLFCLGGDAGVEEGSGGFAADSFHDAFVVLDGFEDGGYVLDFDGSAGFGFFEEGVDFGVEAEAVVAEGVAEFLAELEGGGYGLEGACGVVEGVGVGVVELAAGGGAVG